MFADRLIASRHFLQSETLGFDNYLPGLHADCSADLIAVRLS
jgi:hypothetical protein